MAETLSATPAVVKNLLITCYGEQGPNERLELSMRAYDPQNNLWLTLQGLDKGFHEGAIKSNFLSVNGKLAIYYVVEAEYDLKIFIMDIHEKLETSVNIRLLWETLFPRGIKPNLSL